MFLNYFSFKKLPFTSPASRNVFYFKMRDLLIWKARRLSIKLKSTAGRNDSGRIVMRSQTSLLYRSKQLQINYNFRFFKPSFVSHFQFIPFKNQLVSLIHYSSGEMTYYLTTEKHKLFAFFYLTRLRALKIFHRVNIFHLLLRLRNTTAVSLIEVTPRKGALYCRSSGSVSKIVKFDAKTFLTLVRLPSGNTKLFSSYSTAVLGRVGFKINRNFMNSKAGYWRMFGKKPIVRGVAKNPVDHPNGGRTKSIRYPKTPWGKTTKFK